MKLLKQRMPYDCVLTSVAMCMDIDPEDLRRDLLHNPEEELWPTALGGWKYRGIQIEDLVSLLYCRGYCAMPFFKRFSMRGVVFENSYPVPMTGNTGILMYPSHVVAWDGEKIYDPRGYIKEFVSDWEEFWLICKIRKE